MTYYTLRKAGPADKPTYALVKWEDDRPEPLDVYTQWIPQRGDGSYNVHSCNCPSRSNPCKHAHMAISLLNETADKIDGKEITLAGLYWEDGELYLAYDLPTPEQLQALERLLTGVSS